MEGDKDGESPSARGKEGVRETEIDKDKAGERTGDRDATEAKMTWIHRTSIDYLRMKSQKKSSA